MLMQLDGTFIIAVISFLIFLYIIKEILYVPITKILDARNQFYEKNLKMQTETKQKSQALLDEKEFAIKKSRQEAGDMIKSASDEAKEKSRNAINKTKKNAIAKAREHEEILTQESKNAKIETRNQISEFVRMLVSKILQEETVVVLEDNQIDKYLKI